MIFVKENEPYVICKNIDKINNFFFHPDFESFKHSCINCNISTNDDLVTYFIAPLKEIKKVFIIEIDENNFC